MTHPPSQPPAQPPRPPMPPRRTAPPAPRPAEEGVGGALLGGAVAALVGAGLWALITKLTNTEWGWIAWGVGLLVGLAMARMTPVRSPTLGVYAALLAMLGLATGKVLTLKIEAASAHEEIIDDPETLTQAFLIDMRGRESFSAEVNTQLARLGQQDTVPDDLWATMMAEAGERMQAAPATERERVAQSAVTQIMGSLTLTDQFVGTLGLFDLLWFFLAIGTAWKMLKD